MKKLFLFTLAIVAIAVTTLFLGNEAAGASLAFLAPIIINNKEVKDFAGFLEAKGIKDISGDIENASEVEKQAYFTGKVEFEGLRYTDMINAIKEGKDENGELKAELEKLKESKIKSLEDALEMQGAVMSALKNGQISGGQVHAIEGSIEKALKDNAENLKKAKSERHNFSFEIKAAGDMLLSTNVSGGTMPQPQRLEGVNDIAERVAATYPLCSILPTDRNAIEWVYEANQDGTIDGTAEGATKDQIDNDFVVTSVSLVKRAAYMKASTEMLDDVSFMSGWLRNKLIVRLFLDVDNQCLNGNNTPPNLNGVINQSTAFSAPTGLAAAIDSANEVDVLVAAITQIKIANQGVSNLTIMMHPVDVALMQSTKVTSTDRRYVERLANVGGSLSLDGTPIIVNNNIAQGDYLVGDFSKATIVQKSGIMVDVGNDGNDFTKNMRTILAEWRGQLFIQNNDRTAFVTGDFATDKAALETP